MVIDDIKIRIDFKSTEFWTDELNPLAKLRLFKVLIALILTFVILS